MKTTFKSAVAALLLATLGACGDGNLPDDPVRVVSATADTACRDAAGSDVVCPAAVAAAAVVAQ